MKNWSVLSRITLTRPDGRVYLDRLRLVQTPWFRVFVHRMDAPDPGIELHDHPWRFFRLILKGGYCECISDARDASQRAMVGTIAAAAAGRAQRPAGAYLNRHPGYMGIVRDNDAHTIVSLLNGPSYSLVVAWGRKREWGFFMPGGWVPHYNYDYKVRRNMVEAGR